MFAARTSRRSRLAISLLAIGATSVFAGASRADVFSFSASIVTYTAPVTGTYDIIAVGAGGAGGPEDNGGVGASVEDTFSLTAGEQLSILVGGQGFTGNGGAGGGGGGTFVIAPGVTPLLIAGGGGGGDDLSDNGQNGGNVDSLGGGGGSGGSGNLGTGGGGGGGLSGDGFTGGADTNMNFGGDGGQSYASGGAGGLNGTTENGDAGSGGFGGGGGGGDGGGGGGGYTGGNGGDGAFPTEAGDGGSSYDAGSDPIFSYADLPADGSVTITQVVPEPASAGMALGAAMLLAIRRPRRSFFTTALLEARRAILSNPTLNPEREDLCVE
jgi:hypothetical protein